MIRKGTPEWDEFHEKLKEEFENSKTTVKDSEKEINALFNKFGLSWDKRMGSLLSTIENNNGYITLDNIYYNLYIYSKLNLDDIVVNIKEGVEENQTNLNLTFEQLSISSINDISSIYNHLDYYIEYLNKEIKNHNNISITSLLNNTSVIHEEGMEEASIAITSNFKLF